MENVENIKRERFERVASKRVQAVLDGLRLIGNCGNRINYSYTEEDVKYMFDEINRAVREAKACYSDTTVAEEKFSFKSNLNLKA